MVSSLLPAVVLLAVAAAAAAVTGVPLGDLVRDGGAVGTAPAVGGLAHVPGVLWAVAGGTALVASVGGLHPGRHLGRLLGAVGVLSLLLAADDLLQLHDRALPGRGVPEEVVVAAYAAVLAAAVLRAGPALTARPDTGVLLLAIGLLGTSVVVDLLQDVTRLGLSGDARVYLEDGLKLCGAAVWLRWVVGLARHPAVVPAARG